ncbi:MAG: putative ABC transporter permease [Clostridiales bacterium]|nr:putative ABC transporter permease [Clostridiales bacterium]
MELLPVFVFGSILYGLIEILWRGWTHWTMLLCGGLCFTLMYLVSGSELSLPKKWILSACIITTVEFIAGCIVNLRLHWQVWDYSALPFNLLGQICPQFILMWFVLSIPGTALCSLLRRLFAR